jgi:hypothetical protein
MSGCPTRSPGLDPAGLDHRGRREPHRQRDSAPGTIQISLIPFTLEHTTLGERRVGDRVHLEGDTIGKYVADMLKGEGRKGEGRN